MIFLYVLLLEGHRYYVGVSGKPGSRLKKHFNGSGSAWTKKHKPVAVLFISPVASTHKKATQIEGIATLKIAKAVGFKNVRGGAYTMSYENYPASWDDNLEDVSEADFSKFEALTELEAQAMIDSLLEEEH